jgi:uncharacterized protein (TIGR02145 family)
MLSILSNKKLIVLDIFLLIFLSCSHSTDTDQDAAIPSYTCAIINNPPNHFLIPATFIFINEDVGCDIKFADSSVWKISVKTSPNNGVQVAASIYIAPYNMRDYTILTNPNTVYAGFKPCFIYHFTFMDHEYTKQRTVTFEFEKTAINYKDAVIAVGDTVPCESAYLVVDIDGNKYPTVKIGAQTWMAENLKVTHYRNGEVIDNVKNDLQWGYTWSAYCDYDNNAYYTAPGHLYNWYAVDDYRFLAPDGWHVPSDNDWKQLEIFLGMSQPEAGTVGWRGTNEGSKMKSALTEWDLDATNESGFSAVPGGYRNSYGDFLERYLSAYYWSSTSSDSNKAWYRMLNRDDFKVGRFKDSTQFGFSVRCVRD